MLIAQKYPLENFTSTPGKSVLLRFLTLKNGGKKLAKHCGILCTYYIMTMYGFCIMRCNISSKFKRKI